MGAPNGKLRFLAWHQIKVDDTSDVKLIDINAKPLDISVSGDWIYMTDIYRETGLYRMKTDGSDPTTVVSVTRERT